MTKKKPPSKNIEHICFHVTNQDLIKAYIAVYHPSDTMFVIWNPKEYEEPLKAMNFAFEKVDLAFNKLMIIQVKDIDDAIWLAESLPFENGPYCQVWTKGTLLTDNIDPYI